MIMNETAKSAGRRKGKGEGGETGEDIYLDRPLVVAVFPIRYLLHNYWEIELSK